MYYILVTLLLVNISYIPLTSPHSHFYVFLFGFHLYFVIHLV